MLSGFARYGMILEAEMVFDQMPVKNERSVAYTTMIDGYYRLESSKKQGICWIKCLIKMLVQFNSGDLWAMLNVDGLMKLDLSKDETKEHSCLEYQDSRLYPKWFICRCLKYFVIMTRDGKKPHHSTFASALSSCSNLAAEQIEKMFEDVDNADVISWNSLLAGYALNGYGKEAVKLFQKMEDKEVVPDEVTFVSKFLHEMKTNVTAEMWGALFGACRMHNNIKIAGRAIEKLLELEPHTSTNLVVLSNMYAELGRWGDVERGCKVALHGCMADGKLPNV
ncbi:hypothetical protein HAX54_045255 [Datura stramonium]|uniref:Pentatricopeptide repeat-containing protein n=1 Tax=Datura stramonium TaxID=4076 RepID=A0ABS8RH92_DATST|nr:hypothetical protein [Datura stramonium]